VSKRSKPASTSSRRFVLALSPETMSPNGGVVGLLRDARALIRPGRSLRAVGDRHGREPENGTPFGERYPWSPATSPAILGITPLL